MQNIYHIPSIATLLSKSLIIFLIFSSRFEFHEATEEQLEEVKPKTPIPRSTPTPKQTSATTPSEPSSGNPALHKRIKSKGPDPDKDRQIEQLRKARFWGCLVRSYICCMCCTVHLDVVALYSYPTSNKSHIAKPKQD